MKRITILLSSLLIVATTFAAEPKRPNILFIIVDDQSPFDLKFYNPKSALQTPNIDRLAARGDGVRRRVSHGRRSAARSARRRGT